MGKGVTWQTEPSLSLSLLPYFFFYHLIFLQVFPSLGEGVEKTNMRPTHTSYSGHLGACRYSVFNF